MRTAARCCQRESWLALRKAAELSAALLPTPLLANAELACNQHQRNKQCIRKACRLFPG